MRGMTAGRCTPPGRGIPVRQHARVGGDRAGDDRRGSQCCRPARLHDQLGRRRDRQFMARRGELDTDALPGAADHACIPASTTVEVSQDAGSVLSVQSQGTLSITGGSLSLDRHGRRLSTTVDLTQSGGTLGGTGTLTVTGSFDWSGGAQTGAGTTMIASGATLSLTDNTLFLFGGRTLQINTGATATVEPTPILMAGQRRDRERRHLQRQRRRGHASIIFNVRRHPALHNTGTFSRAAPARSSMTSRSTTTARWRRRGHAEPRRAATRAPRRGNFTGSGTDARVRFGRRPSRSRAASTCGAGTSSRQCDADTCTRANVPLTAGTFTQSGGTLGGAGTLTVTGTFDWTAAPRPAPARP